VEMGRQHTYPLKRLQKLGHKNAIKLSKTQKYKGDPPWNFSQHHVPLKRFENDSTSICPPLCTGQATIPVII
jgi:hypothetical protein